MRGSQCSCAVMTVSSRLLFEYFVEKISGLGPRALRTSNGMSSRTKRDRSAKVNMCDFVQYMQSGDSGAFQAAYLIATG